MQNHCLKFPNEKSAIALMPQFRGKDESGNEQWLLASHTHALDPIGDVHKPTGKMIKVEGIDTHEMTKSDGWHCNLMVDKLPANLAYHIVVPQFPKRVWA